jgi:hypothetical protein
MPFLEFFSLIRPYGIYIFIYFFPYVLLLFFGWKCPQFNHKNINFKNIKKLKNIFKKIIKWRNVLKKTKGI